MEKTQLEKKATLIENMLNAIETNKILFEKVFSIIKEIEIESKLNIFDKTDRVIDVFVSYKNIDQIDRERIKNYLRESGFEIEEKKEGFHVILKKIN